VAVLVAVPAVVRPQDDALDTWCRARLESFKVPERYVWAHALPRDALGKLRRKSLLAALRAAPESVAGTLVPLFGDDLGATLDHDAGHASAESQAGEPVAQGSGDWAGAQGHFVEAGVHQPDVGAKYSLGDQHAVGEGDRCLAETFDIYLDAEDVPQARRAHVVGVAVDQRHQPLASPEAVFERAKDDVQDLFERRMAVLVETREEDHAGSVDVAEANGDAMLESHVGPLRQSDRVTGVDSTHAGCLRKRVGSKE
jgi:hypothetical protein